MNPPTTTRREIGTANDRACWMLPNGCGVWRMYWYPDGKAFWESTSRTIRIGPNDPEHPSQPTCEEYVS